MCFFKQYLKQLTEKNIKYSILRNYEELNEEIIEGDVDILIRKEDIKLAIDLFEGFGGMKFPILNVYNRGDHVQLEVLNQEFNSTFKIDFQTNISYFGVSYYTYEEIITNTFEKSGIIVLNEKIEVISILLHCILEKDTIKEQYRVAIASYWENDSTGFEKELSNKVGPYIKNIIIEHIEQRKWDDMLSLKTRVLFYTTFKRKKSLLKILNYFKEGVFRISKRTFSPDTPLIVLLGVDGAGKTTISKEIMEKLDVRGLRAKTVHFGAMPNVFPAIPMINNMVGRILRVTNYFKIYYFQIQKWRGKEEIVVCDRYFYDILLARKLPKKTIYIQDTN